MCETIPSLPPTTRQSSTRLAGSCDANEMSIPCVAAPGRERISQSLDLELALAGVDPVELRRLDDDAVELDALGVADLDPVLAAADGQVPQRDVVRRDRGCRRGRSRLPRRRRSGRGRGRAAPGARRPRAGRSAARPPTRCRARRASATGAAAERPTPARPSSPPSSGHVRWSSGSAACASSCASSQVPAKKRSAGRSGAPSSSSRAAARVSPSSSSPSGTAAQPGWYGSSGW